MEVTEGRAMQEIDDLVKQLEKDVTLDQEVEEKRSFEWVKECDYNLWTFQREHQAIMWSLEDELDISEWDEVAEAMGLSYQQIQSCRNNKWGTFTRKAFSIMQERPEYHELTLKDFLEVLLQHKRHDILLKMEKYVRLREPQGSETKSFSLSVHREAEVAVGAVRLVTTTTTTTKPSQVNGKPVANVKVLLLHAYDTKDDALQLATLLRSSLDPGQITLLLLQESDIATVRQSLRADPWNSLSKWFAMTNVVIPVLSPLFLQQIQNLDEDEEERGWEKRYNRYVYMMALNHFVHSGCRNYFCYPVCPDRFQQEVNNNKVMEHSHILKPYSSCSSEAKVQQYARRLYMNTQEFLALKKRWKKKQAQREC